MTLSKYNFWLLTELLLRKPNEPEAAYARRVFHQLERRVYNRLKLKNQPPTLEHLIALMGIGVAPSTLKNLLKTSYPERFKPYVRESKQESKPKNKVRNR